MALDPKCCALYLPLAAALIAPLCCFSAETAAPPTTEAKGIVRQFYAHETDFPSVRAIRVRALVHVVEQPKTVEFIESRVKKQVEEELQRQKDRGLPKGMIAEEVLTRFEGDVRKRMNARYGGDRWFLYEEIVLPGFYRLDSRDYGATAPPVDDTLVYSTTVFSRVEINNYSRSEPHYKEANGSYDGKEMFFNSNANYIKWKQKNLFLLSRLPSNLVGLMVVTLCTNLGIAERTQLAAKYSDEIVEVAPCIPLDEQKLGPLFGASLKISVRGGSNAKVFDMALNTTGKDGTKVQMVYVLDPKLPFLATDAKASINGVVIESLLRSEVSDLGLPLTWVHRKFGKDGQAERTETGRILAVSTNLDYANIWVTNIVPGFKMWERGDGVLRPISVPGVKKAVVLQKAARQQLSAQTTKPSRRMVVVALLLTGAIVPAAALVWALVRKGKRGKMEGPTNMSRLGQ